MTSNEPDVPTSMEGYPAWGALHILDATLEGTTRLLVELHPRSEATNPLRLSRDEEPLPWSAGCILDQLIPLRRSRDRFRSAVAHGGQHLLRLPRPVDPRADHAVGQ